MTLPDQNGNPGPMRTERYAIPMPACPSDFLTGLQQDPGTADEAIETWIIDFLQANKVQLDQPEDIAISEPTPILNIKTASHPWEVIDDWSLLGMAGGRGLERFLFMPRGYTLTPDPNGPDIPTTDFTGNIPALLQAVLAYRTDTIYLQVSPHTRSEYLVFLIRYLRPTVKLLVEFYDMGALFSPDRLKGGIGYNREECSIASLAAWSAGTSANAVIAKSSGEDWLRLAASFKGAAFSWYPMHAKLCQSKSPSSSAPAQVKQYRRVVFAGSLGDTELVKGPSAATDANFLETLAILMQHDEVQLGVFNAADRRLLGDKEQRFVAIEDWFGKFESRHRYSPAIAENDLIESMQTYDFGFFCVHYADPIIEHVGRLAIPNRVMAYLSAGLPIIVDTYAEAVSELVIRFNAGIVIDPKDYRELPQRLVDADMENLKAGAENLARHIVKTNEQTISDLTALLEWKG